MVRFKYSIKYIHSSIRLQLFPNQLAGLLLKWFTSIAQKYIWSTLMKQKHVARALSKVEQ